MWKIQFVEWNGLGQLVAQFAQVDEAPLVATWDVTVRVTGRDEQAVRDLAVGLGLLTESAAGERERFALLLERTRRRVRGCM